MNRTMNSMLMIAAATLTMGVSAAYGQSALQADIPFSFQAAGKTLPAGAYKVRESDSRGGARILTISSGKVSVMVMGNSPLYSSDHPASEPVLKFSCVSSGCALSAVWDGSSGVEFAKPRLTPAQRERIATVRLTSPANGQ
jgi:hypothetical protein